jgi:hypothetical protein
MDTELLTQAIVTQFMATKDALKSQLDDEAENLLTKVNDLISQINQMSADLDSQLQAHRQKDATKIGTADQAHAGVDKEAKIFRALNSGPKIGTYVIKLSVGGKLIEIPASDNINGVCHTYCDKCSDHCKIYGGIF